MNQWFAEHLIFTPIYKARGEAVKKYWREVSSFHKKSLDEMLTIQLDKVKKLAVFLYTNNPYYKNLFDTNGIRPEDIKQISDFTRIPAMTKSIMQSDMNNLLSSVKMRSSPRKTSGSSGIPLWFIKDRTASAYMDAVMYEVYGWHGIKMGDRQARLWGMPLDWQHRLRWKMKDALLNRIRKSAFDMSAESCLAFYEWMIRAKSKYIYGYPSTTCEFISVLKDNNCDFDRIKLNCAITTGEMLYDEQRAIIQDNFRCKAVNEYGCTENGIIAFECPAGNMHLMIHNLLIEFIDPATGKPAANDSMGEIYLTELHSYLLPFVRYKTSDIATRSDKSCSCGSKLPIIEGVHGRETELLVTPDGKRITGAIINYTMTQGVRRVKAVQKKNNEILVHIEKYPGYETAIDVEVVKNKWRALVGDKMTITVELVDKLPVDKSGKLRSFTVEK
jgi:phenylacetate-CoA ligase